MLLIYIYIRSAVGVFRFVSLARRGTRVTARKRDTTFNAYDIYYYLKKKLSGKFL